jgi:DNA replication protein DnaC
VGGDGERYAQPCECRIQVQATRLLKRAAIPKRYEHCTLDTFEPGFGQADQSLAKAYRMARRFVDEYPVTTEGCGLLLTGSVGVGKTHLAVGIVQALISDKGVRGLFCDYRELLKRIQESYNAQVASSELQILAPVFEAVALILNTRYNDKRTTLITTNYPNAAAALVRDAPKANREETLGDRIGERMRSRLAEMCVEVEMRGSDFRQSVKKARFG